MASEAQIAANRRNALNSTGPRTDEGKRASARNAVKHGLYSSLDSFTEAERNDVEDYFEHHFNAWNRPSDDEAHRLIREIALADYRRERTRGATFRMMAHQHADTDDEAESYFGEVVEIGTRDAIVFQHDFAGRNNFTRLGKMENAFTRHLDKCTKELKQRLARLAAEQPAKPAPPKSTAPPEPRSHELDETNPIHPRGAACPCGSGEKYKRCCGRNAPPQLHPGAQAA
jgi:hypothetical protein